MPTRILNKVVILHTNDFEYKTSKIAGWVSFNGGCVVETLDDTVTHLVSSKRAFTAYADVIQKARRRGTIYIVSFDWLENSLMPPRKRCKEVDYAFEKEHAERVPQKLKLMKENRRRSNKKSLKEEAMTKEIDIRKEQTEISIGELMDLGLKFEKSCLEHDLQMASRGYHPLMDDHGKVYVVNLVRSDIYRRILEKISLKVSTNPHAARISNRPWHLIRAPVSNVIIGTPPRPAPPAVVLDRACSRPPIEVSRTLITKPFVPENGYAISENTILHYLHDPLCCLRHDHQAGPLDFEDSDVESLDSTSHIQHLAQHLDQLCLASTEGLSAGNDEKLERRSESVLKHWPACVPFSNHPVIAYHDHTQTTNSEKPYAYTLQIYEHRPDPGAGGNTLMTPNFLTQCGSEDIPSVGVATVSRTVSLFDPSNSSLISSSTRAARLSRGRTDLTKNLPSPSNSVSYASVAATTDFKDGITNSLKKYAVTITYSKPPHRPVEQILAHPGSTWQFARNVFCRVFEKKSGVKWENAVGDRAESESQMAVEIESGDIAKAETTAGPGKHTEVHEDATVEPGSPAAAQSSVRDDLPDKPTRSVMSPKKVGTSQDGHQDGVVTTQSDGTRGPHRGRDQAQNPDPYHQDRANEDENMSEPVEHADCVLHVGSNAARDYRLSHNNVPAREVEKSAIFSNTSASRVRTYNYRIASSEEVSSRTKSIKAALARRKA